MCSISSSLGMGVSQTVGSAEGRGVTLGPSGLFESVGNAAVMLGGHSAGQLLMW